MTWLAILLALLLEQFQPLPKGNVLYRGYRQFVDMVESNFNAGEYRHGVLGFAIAVAVPTALTLLLWGIFYLMHPLAAWLFGFAVLYVTMGFRQFSAAFSAVSEALKEGDLDTARRKLSNWTRQSTSQMDADELSRMAIEYGLVDAYRHVFGPLFWFLILGPAGAVAYRAATILQRKWGARDAQTEEHFGEFATQAGEVADWLPIRITAVSFAVMGDFEDAVYCWRQQAEQWMNQAYGILLAAGAGAIGVRLGLPIHQDHTLKFRPELGLGAEAEPAALASAVGLVWRTLLFWMALLLVLTIASWF